LYRQTYNKGEYPGPDYMIPFGKASVRRDGSNVVVFTWGALVQRSLLAAQQAEKEGISVMVVDLRTIAPFDWDAIAAAVKHTNRVVIAHEDQLTCGFGAELAARIADQLFEHLDAPVRRVAGLDTPVAYAPVLEEVILPQSAHILKAVLEVARY
jgi:2-oxoisovalerate dehydrogenase E1 component